MNNNTYECATFEEFLDELWAADFIYISTIKGLRQSVAVEIKNDGRIEDIGYPHTRNEQMVDAIKDVIRSIANVRRFISNNE